MITEPNSPQESLLRRLRTPLLVLGSLFVLDLALRATSDIWERHSPDDYTERVRGCAAEPRDFVLLGGSPVSEGLDPAFVRGVRWRGEVLESGYAIGLPGGTTTDFYHAVKLACPTPPKLLVYGITASDLNDRRNEPHGVHSLMAMSDLLELTRIRPDAGEWAARHYVQARIGDTWAAFRYRHGIRMAAALTADSYWPDCCPEATREARELRGYAEKLRAGTGYAPAAGFEFRRYDEVKANHWEQPPFQFLDRYATGSHLKYLDRLMEWCVSHRADLILLDMPVTADLENTYPAVMAEYQQRLSEIEAAGRVTILRAPRDAVGLSDSDFADIIHLNRIGAGKLSGWLRDQLESPVTQSGPLAPRADGTSRSELPTVAEVRRP